MMHSIKIGIPEHDDEFFYESYYGTTLGMCESHMMDDDASELEIYITSFDGLIYAKYQVKTLLQFLKCDVKIVFCDTNSHVNPVQSKLLKELCVQNNIGYVKLPHNKFQDLESFSMKLGVDLNWIWRNCVKVRKPKYFAFLDQDCFIIRDSWDYLKSYLDVKGMYGLAWPQDTTPIESPYWLVHIMNNLFKFDFVEKIDLDFRPAGFVALDTSGCNYFTLFKDHDRLDYIQSESYISDHVGSEWSNVFRNFTVHDGRWIHIRNSTKTITNDINEKEYREVYMTGILDGILFAAQFGDI